MLKNERIRVYESFAVRYRIIEEKQDEYEVFYGIEISELSGGAAEAVELLPRMTDSIYEAFELLEFIYENEVMAGEVQYIIDDIIGQVKLWR